MRKNKENIDNPTAKKKKPWITPQLIVLVKGKSEEWVLQGCKVVSVIPGPLDEVTACMGIDPCAGPCNVTVEAS